PGAEPISLKNWFAPSHFLQHVLRWAEYSLIRLYFILVRSQESIFSIHDDEHSLAAWSTKHDGPVPR
ncbi:hypothetical protein ACXX9E_29350, partial [Pseudomonas sp. GNP014]